MDSRAVRMDNYWRIIGVVLKWGINLLSLNQKHVTIGEPAMNEKLIAATLKPIVKRLIPDVRLISGHDTIFPIIRIASNH